MARPPRVGRQDLPCAAILLACRERQSMPPRCAPLLGRAVGRGRRRELARATEALVARYRSVAPASAPILASRVHVAAYASYRMPATHAALSRVLGAVAARGLGPRSMLDLGGGTGAAAWAAAGRLRGRSSRSRCWTRSRRRWLWGATSSPTHRRRPWPARRSVGPSPARGPSVEADLVTVSYVLSELDERAAGRARRRRDAPRTGRRRRRARHPRRLRPGPRGSAARLHRGRLAAARPVPPRAALPSRARATGATSRPGSTAPLSTAGSRAAELSYEDEKFSWVAAASPRRHELPAAEPLRHGSSDIP